MLLEDFDLRQDPMVYSELSRPLTDQEEKAIRRWLEERGYDPESEIIKVPFEGNQSDYFRAKASELPFLLNEEVNRLFERLRQLWENEIISTVSVSKALGRCRDYNLATALVKFIKDEAIEKLEVQYSYSNEPVISGLTISSHNDQLEIENVAIIAKRTLEIEKNYTKFYEKTIMVISGPNFPFPRFI